MGYNHLRPALLEKMPPMQISRVSAQNCGSPDGDGSAGENGSVELLENGLDDMESMKGGNIGPISHSVSQFSS